MLIRMQMTLFSIVARGALPGLLTCNDEVFAKVVHASCAEALQAYTGPPQCCQGGAELTVCVVVPPVR